jgi:hypothetical protein
MIELIDYSMRVLFHGYLSRQSDGQTPRQPLSIAQQQKNVAMRRLQVSLLLVVISLVCLAITVDATKTCLVTGASGMVSRFFVVLCCDCTERTTLF